MRKKAYRRTPALAVYLSVLSFCVGAYFLYLSFVVPLVEVAVDIPRAQIAEGAYRQVEDDNQHRRWFNEGDWEREPCSVLHTGQGKILFDDYEIVDAKTWLVFPFSLVLDRAVDTESPDNELPPLILRCEKGARLKLDQAVSATAGGSKFPLRSAQLEGNVELYRRASGEGGDDDLRIETSNIQIDNDQILTIDDVVFRFGNNSGIGRNLSIQLSHDTPGNSLPGDFSGINGITNIRLGVLSSMRILPTKKVGGGSGRMLSTDNTPIEITADGPFEFDFVSNVARFEDRVMVRKLDRFGDTLRCNELSLQFKSTSSTQAFQLDAATDSKFELESIVAKGEPAVLDSRSQKARVEAQFLEYDLATQIVSASDQHQVEIVKDDSQFVAKAIQYRLTNNRTLGSLSAAGPGHLLRNEGSGRFKATWSKMLTLSRSSDQQHSIRLTGDVHIQSDVDSSLTADEVVFSIWEVPVFGQNNEFVRWTYQPDNLVALNRVHVSSEKLISDAGKLTANWPSNPKAAQQVIDPIHQIGAVKQRSADFSTNYSTSIGTRFAGLTEAERSKPSGFGQQLVVQRHRSARAVSLQSSETRAMDPKPTSNLVRRVSFQEPISKPRPIMAKGKEINIVVVDKQNQKMEIVDLQIDGQVTVSKPSNRIHGKPEFEIFGDSLRLIPQGEQLFRIQVNGTNNNSARVNSERLVLTGKQVFFDQSTNRMWVTGNGQVKLNGGQTPAIDSNEHRAAPNLDVMFDGGMVFNGSDIYFERNVEANIHQRSQGITSTTHAIGNALKIRLDRRLNFSELDNDSANAELQVVEMIFQQKLPAEQTQFKQAGFKKTRTAPVVIKNQKVDSGGKVIEQLTLSTPHAVVKHAQNNLIAYGPGFVQIYRRGNNGKRPAGFGFVGNRMMQNDSNSLTYIHVNFDNQVVANTASNEIVITGNLRSIYAPVENLGQSFEPDRPGKLPIGAVRLNCDRIDIVQSKLPFVLQPKTVFIASGNAQINSDTFESTADRIHYADDTDVLTVNSTTKKNVVLKVRRDVHSKWLTSVGSELVYRLSDQTASIKNVKRISGNIRSDQ